MLAAVLSAAMSTLSSSLNASASALWNDFCLPRYSNPPSPQKQLLWTRLATVAFGILQVGIGIQAQYIDDTVVKSALTIAGYSAGLLLGIFSLGVLSKRAGQASALIGATTGLTVLLSVQFLAPQFDYSVAWPWFAMIGSVTTFVTGQLVALAFPREQKEQS